MDKDLKYSFKYQLNDKEREYQTKGAVLWLTGLSGSGKSTIANELESLAVKEKKIVKIIDGDDLRAGLCSDLKFSKEDRTENLRRAAEVASLFANNATLTICCFISPLEEQRKLIKSILGDFYHLIYVKTPLATCENRDPKGLYKRARSGEIPNFTGISSEYEEPSVPNLVIDTAVKSAKECALEIFDYYQNLD